MEKPTSLLFGVMLSCLLSTSALAAGTPTAYESGLANAEENRWNEAIGDFSKAIQQNPNDEDAYQQRSRCYMSLKNYKAAIADCDTALRLNPHKGRSFGYRGFAYLLTGQLQKGIEDCKQAVALDHPDELDVVTPGIYFNLAKAMRMTGHPDLAVQYERRAGILDLVKKAKETREKKQIDEAIHLLDVAIQRSPHETSAYFVRGVMLNNKSEYDKAIADFSTAIKLEPDFFSARYFRADAYSQLGKHKKAIEDYDKIISYTPRLVAFRLVTETGRLRDKFFGKDDQVVNLEDIYYLRGHAKAEAGDKAGAMADYETAARLSPSDTEPSARKAELQSKSGQTKLAINSLSASVKLDANNWQALASRARVYQAEGDYKRAMSDYSKIIALHPKDPGAYFLRAQLSEKLGDLKGAIKDYSEMIVLKADDDDAYKCRGDCYLKSGDAKKAIDDYSVLIKRDPNNSSSIFACRATAYEKSGQRDLAAKDRLQAMDKLLHASVR